uniref:CCT domain-containing protein n=1 Tax=Leersia perrieri TaxID=77586 RepID=A0A0D9VB76_9ORYZ
MLEDANLGIDGKEMTGTTTTTTITGKEEALLVDNANQQDYFQTWTNSFDSGAFMGPGALQEPSYFDLESYLDPDQKIQPDASLLQPLNTNNTPYVQFPMMDTNINNDIKATHSSSDNIELMQQSSLLQPPLTMNDMSYDQLQMIDTNTSNDASSEFPGVNFQSSSNTGLLGGSSMFDCQDQQVSNVLLPEKSCPDPEKRKRAKDRYLLKRLNRRFDKQIMYASRKATADTRKRVRGRFVKASSEQASSPSDNKQLKHETN